MKKLLFTFCFLLSAIRCFSQILIDTVTYIYYDDVGVEYKIWELKVRNNTEDIYFTWISPDSIIKKSKKDQIHDFFIKRYGDFSYLDLYYEGLLHRFSWSNRNFIKKINPNETFTYDVLYKNINTYENKIVIVTKDEIESIYNIDTCALPVFENESVILPLMEINKGIYVGE